MNWHRLDIEETIEMLETSKTGLSKTKVEANLLEFGMNQLHEGKKKSNLDIFFRQFKNKI
jgi:magnesium-transporting ATPase (P-type)